MGCCLGEDARLAVAPLAQSLFFRPRERWSPRGRRRRAMAVEALVPPDTVRVATRGAAHSPTVYTNAPKRRQEAIFANRCTLLRPHVCPQRRNSVHKWSKTAPRDHFSQSVYTSLPLGASRPRRCPHPGGGRQDWARATGRCHGSHDIDGPMAPVMPGCSDLRPTPSEQ